MIHTRWEGGSLRAAVVAQELLYVFLRDVLPFKAFKERSHPTTKGETKVSQQFMGRSESQVFNQWLDQQEWLQVERIALAQVARQNINEELDISLSQGREGHLETVSEDPITVTTLKGRLDFDTVLNEAFVAAKIVRLTQLSDSVGLGLTGLFMGQREISSGPAIFRKYFGNTIGLALEALS
jgi:hypothetical protein